MIIQTDPTKPIATEVHDLGVKIEALKKRLEAIDSTERIDYENQMDILIQRQRALTIRLDAIPDANPATLPADIPREVAELKRAVIQVADRLSTR